MWPFRRPKKISKTKFVVGLVIGGAIAATVGKKLMEQGAGEKEDEDDEGRDDDKEKKSEKQKRS